MEILILVLSYLVSLLVTWKFFQKAHSKGGRWSGVTPNILDFLMTITPIFNTIVAIIYIIDIIINQVSFDFSKFFKIKK